MREKECFSAARSARYWPICLAFVLFFASANAAVLDASESGFTVEAEVQVNAPRSDVYQAFVKDVGRWWSPELTVSGYSESLYIDARPMGCFCEALANGGMVHLAVTLVDTNNMLRLTGGFGPLGLMGVSGNMTIEFSDVGEAAEVKMQYAVGGYHPDGLDAMADQVDAVLEAQLERLRRFVETGSPDASE